MDTGLLDLEQREEDGCPNPQQHDKSEDDGDQSRDEPKWQGLPRVEEIELAASVSLN